MNVSLSRCENTIIMVVDIDIYLRYNTFEELPQTLHQVVPGSDSNWRGLDLDWKT